MSGDDALEYLKPHASAPTEANKEREGHPIYVPPKAKAKRAARTRSAALSGARK
jgi:hypothetical protein